MLTKMLIALTLAGYTLSNNYVYATEHDYTSKSENYDLDILAEIRSLDDNIAGLIKVNGDIDNRILGLTATNKNNVHYIDDLTYDLKDWINTIDKQNAEIADLELQAVKLLSLADDVVNIGEIVDQLSQKSSTVDAEISELQNIIRDLRNLDDKQNETLTLADKQLSDHEKVVGDLEIRVLNSLQKIKEQREIVDKVNCFLNGQNTEQIEFNITDKHPVQTKRAAANFGERTPHIMLAICDITISDGSKSFKPLKKMSPHPSSGVYRRDNGSDVIVPVGFPERVAWDASVQFDPLTRDVTVRFNDYSMGGWKVTEISALPLLLAAGLLG